jgi:predicted alpha/beta superfamily hydrolase
MKYFLFSLFVFILYQTSHAQTTTAITIGVTDTIYSKVLQKKRTLLVYTPAGANNNPRGSVRYPVMYLLDGESFFHSFTGMVQYLSSTGVMPEMIVVGIVNTDRTMDLTPTHSVYWSDGEKDEKALHTSGGGEKFISFIQNEVIPHVESHYSTAPYRMLVGHSLGGLTVLNAIINHAALFNAYVAIDPSVWWDHKALMNKAGQVLATKNYTGKSLFYSSANTMDKRMDTLRVMMDTAHANIHVRDNLQFRSLLQQDHSSYLSCQWKYYPDDNHASVPLIAGYDALRFLFKGYRLPKEMDDPSLTAEDIRLHYQNVSKIMGYEVSPSEKTVNQLGYAYLANKRYNEAYNFFKMNIAAYPQSFNVYDSMADYYLAIGDKKNASLVLTQALRLKENPDTRKKLQSLKGGL